MPIMCNECGIRPATVHYTEIVNTSKVTMELCQQGAERKGIDVQKAGKYGLGDLVAGLIDSTAPAETDMIGLIRCPSCGYNYSDFKKVGRFGCPDCYDAFEDELSPLLRAPHLKEIERSRDYGFEDNEVGIHLGISRRILLPVFFPTGK